MSGGGGGLVLIAEHEAAVAELARRYLAREGLEVEIEADPGRAAAAAARLRPAAVVLDLSTAPLPADLYRRVAEAARPAPVVAVAARPEDAPRAPFRVARPFGPRDLVAAVLLAVRGDGGPGAGPLRAGAVVLDPAGRAARLRDAPVALTGTEFDLLEFLMGNPGRVFTREQLLAGAWGPGTGAGSRTVDVHVAQLRAKLGGDSPIRTVRGVGYVLDA
ncbi:winged helix-turn-helix transcriptional regulator [Actinomadura parmotrematis]|uniref:Response regulator transcription factor n=1 Tax=Actinomadura parmotrematis TaxID=2864039 RepID=A0ABS7FLE4_9ACTN|nr:response regulator transcription factor [Actinomadura parmotrematis]MBW8481075.1 response regulator transcription factor [Actinomadura parmotrematis]